MRKSIKWKFKFLIDLAAIIIVAKDKVATKEEPKMFDKAWNHPDMES